MTPGDQVGHYHILEPLGKGGMGEVFLAEDTRLHRRVALKVLPPTFATDPAHRERFEREARAVAALNHPNIVTIHSVEEHDGRLLLTMELVEGKPLGELIPRGGMPLDKLLKIAIEIADAMATAQQHGITHRDLKPANVMVTSTGRAKVLDFGVAKLREAGSATDDLTRAASPGDLTGEGKIVGTVAYMSPEQAEGKPVDPRSDIFSFGVMLYEMATGERPFRGDTQVSIISSILRDTPASLTESNPNLPADLSRIVRRCLAKDQDRRYQTAADLRNELEDLRQDTASGVVAAPLPVRKKGRWIVLVASAAALLVTIAGVWFALGLRPGTRPADAATFAIDRLVRLTTTGSAFIAAISADGRYVVHVKGEPGGVGLWIRQTATTSDVRIVAPADVRFDGLTFAPDGNYVFYNTYTGNGGLASLYRVPALGGSPSKVIDDVDSGVTFSPDTKRMAFMRGSPTRGTTDLMIASVDGGDARALAAAPASDKFQSEAPAWSPDGTTILATAASTRPSVPALIYAIDAHTGSTRAIGDPWGYVRDVQWLPDGRSFLATAIDLSGLATAQIWRVAYPSGERSRVSNDLNAYGGVSLSADGRSLATVQSETVAAIYVGEGPNKEPRKVGGGAGRADGVNGLSWLPDGRIVYTSTASGLPQLWVADVDGANARQLTSQVPPATAPYASSDGKWIYFSSYADVGAALFRIAPDGSGLQQLTTDGDARGGILSPDGKLLYFTALRTGAPRPMKVSSDGGKPEAVSDKYFRAIDISPDGERLLGVVWSEAERRAVPGVLWLKDGRIEPLTGLPTNVAFMPDGSYVFMRRIEGKSVLFTRPANGGPDRPLTPPTPDFLYGGAVSRDGRIAFSRGQSISDVVLIKAK